MNRRNFFGRALGVLATALGAKHLRGEPEPIATVGFSQSIEANDSREPTITYSSGTTGSYATQWVNIKAVPGSWSYTAHG